MENNNEHRAVVSNPTSTRTSERTESLLVQIKELEDQLGIAHDTISGLNNMLAFERKRHAS